MKTQLLLAVTALAALASPAPAQVATGFGDLVLAFTPAARPVNVEIRLGDIRAFEGVAPGTYNLGNYDPVLTTGLTSGWSSDPGLAWGVLGAIDFSGHADFPSRTVWGTSARSISEAGTLGVQNSAAYGAGNSATLGVTTTSAHAAYTTLSGGTGTTLGNAKIFANSNGGANQSFTLPPALFRNTVTKPAPGRAYSAADLYRLAPDVPPVFVGTFALYQNGDVTFTVAAIPEPSTCAAILGVATLGFAAIRRRKRQNEAQV